MAADTASWDKLFRQIKRIERSIEQLSRVESSSHGQVGGSVFGDNNNLITLYNSGGESKTDYEPTVAGLLLAIGAAWPGDAILVRNGTYVTDLTLPAGVHLVGLNPDGTIIAGMITGAGGCSISNLGITPTGALGVLMASAGTLALHHCNITVKPASGPATGVQVDAAAGIVALHECDVKGISADADGYAVERINGAIYVWGGSLEGSTSPTHDVITVPSTPILEDFTVTDLTPDEIDENYAERPLSGRVGWDAGSDSIARWPGDWGEQDLFSIPTGIAYREVNSGPNCEAYITIPKRPANSGFISVITRYDPVNDNGYYLSAGRDDSNGDRLEVGRYHAGHFIYASAAIDFQDGDKILLRTIGGKLMGWHLPVGGTWLHVVDAISAEIQGAGRLGFIYHDNNLTPHVDDFGGGDIDGLIYIYAANLITGTAGDGDYVAMHGDRGAWDVMTYPGEHASDLAAGAPLHHVPEGLTTGDFVRYNATEGRWEVASEPVVLKGLILTPELASLVEAEGAMFYDAATKHVTVGVDS